MRPGGSQNAKSGIQNGTSGSLADLLDTSRFQGRTREQVDIRFILSFCVTWRFGVSIWRPLDLKEVKSCVFKDNHIELWKRGPRRGFEKHRFYLFWMPQGEAIEYKKRFPQCNFCNLESFGGHDHWWKMEARMASTRHQHRGLGRPRSHFSDLLGVRKMCVFIIFGFGKQLATNRKYQGLW